VGKMLVGLDVDRRRADLLHAGRGAEALAA
jgi:hypothetical protein